MFFTLYPRKPKKPKKIKEKSRRRKEKIANDDEFSDSLDYDFEEFKQELSYENVVDNADNEDVNTDSVDEHEEQEEIAEEKQTESPPAKHHKKKDKKKKEKPPREKKESKLASFKEKYYKYKPYFPMGWKYFKKLLKAIRITGVKINLDVGREDAHEAAIYYGAVEGIVFNTLGQLSNMFTVKIKRADVNCVFTKNIIDGSAECYVRVRPSTIIAIAVCVGVNFLVIYLKQRRANKKKQINENINTGGKTNER
ncbi:MAG: DUF2953 domain-containing protein [Ruminococcus sp.]|nr:DUF2953 domain-containing protein [Ruminococcus sp.]